jgi:hypothetical protein
MDRRSSKPEHLPSRRVWRCVNKFKDPLYTREVRARLKKLGANFEHFGLVV